MFSAAFGRRTSWTAESTTELPTGHNRTFQAAVTSAAHNMFTRALTPNWIYNFSQHIHIPFLSATLKETRESFHDLKFHMLDLISLAHAWVSDRTTSPMEAALLRNLVEANMTPEEGCLTDDELLSNIFVRSLP
jgi:hypothetical protein